MDEFDNFSCHQDDSHSASYYAPVTDHYMESYNYCTTDPIAIGLRHQREEQERHMFDVEADQMATPDQVWAPDHGQAHNHVWTREAPHPSKHFTSPTCGSPSDDAFRKAAAVHALLCADDPDAPHEALAATAAGRKYYHLPGEPLSWRRPLRGPSGTYDVKWWMMFHAADGRSTDLANWLGYIGARDDDGWIRPTRWELLRMGFQSVQRYAFYYAEFAEEFGRNVPRWVELLRPVRAHTPSAELGLSARRVRACTRLLLCSRPA